MNKIIITFVALAATASAMAGNQQKVSVNDSSFNTCVRKMESQAGMPLAKMPIEIYAHTLKECDSTSAKR